MPSAEIFLAYHNTPPTKRLKFNPFPRPTVFSFVDPKGKLVITCPFEYEVAKHDFYRRALAEKDFILVAEKMCARFPKTTPKHFHAFREELIGNPRTSGIFWESLNDHGVIDSLAKHEKILDIAVRKKYGLRIAIFLRIFLYCKLISRAKIYGTK